MIKDAWKSYKCDLLDYVGVGLSAKKQYKSVFEALHDMEFAWKIDRDDNRADDGIRLRRKLGYDFGNRPCSVLEMLVGLAMRVDYEFIGSPADPKCEIFFGEMISNLGLDVYREKMFDFGCVRQIVNRWMNREFKFDGTGSIFPVRFDIHDQRKLEIWDQMLNYINERW